MFTRTPLAQRPDQFSQPAGRGNPLPFPAHEFYKLPVRQSVATGTATEKNNPESSKKTAVRQISDFDHFKVFLGRAALRTHPVFRYVLPPGAGRKALIREAVSFAVDESAYDTYIFLVSTHYAKPHLDSWHRPTCRPLYTFDSAAKHLPAVLE
jgi:hypothetical protein